MSRRNKFEYYGSGKAGHTYRSYGGNRPEPDNSAIGPHALTAISGVPSNFPTEDLNVTYTDFKKIATLSENNKYYKLTYGVDNQRRKSEYYENGISQGAPTLTRYYLGDYEEEVSGTNVRKIHYLSGAIFIQETNQPDKFYYSYSDYQGSLIAMINEGGEFQEYAYDPWGARRNPTNWNEKDSRTSWILNRGYTGHEHIDQFGIINMNGRVYDPLTAQFFSPDPVLQAPGNWTNYNRYTYCMNNPFKYTDPSGYIMVNDEEGNYHFDAGSGAYQSRFDESGSIYLEGQRVDSLSVNFLFCIQNSRVLSLVLNLKLPI